MKTLLLMMLTVLPAVLIAWLWQPASPAPQAPLERGDVQAERDFYRGQADRYGTKLSEALDLVETWRTYATYLERELNQQRNR